MKYYPICILMGDKFSPSLAEAKTDLRFASKVEPGEVGKKGRYRNVPQPYGSATLSSPRENYAALHELLDALSRNINLLRGCGVEKIKYYLTVSYSPGEEQCNLEFDAVFLKMLAELWSAFIDINLAVDKRGCKRAIEL